MILLPDNTRPWRCNLYSLWREGSIFFEICCRGMHLSTRKSGVSSQRYGWDCIECGIS